MPYIKKEYAEKIINDFLAEDKMNINIYTQEDLEKVMADYPELTDFGFELRTAKSYISNRESLKKSHREFHGACTYLSTCEKSKNIRNDVNSYVYKHRVERLFRPYISNGCFIAAAIHMGFKFKQRTEGPNAYFNLIDTRSKNLEKISKDSFKQRFAAMHNMILL